MMRKAGGRHLPHPTRYLGADDEIKLSRDEAPPKAAAARDREQSTEA
jgi:hypothetical protein